MSAATKTLEVDACPAGKSGMAQLRKARAALSLWLLALPPEQEFVPNEQGSSLQVSMRAIAERMESACSLIADTPGQGMPVFYASEFLQMMESTLWQLISDEIPAVKVADLRCVGEQVLDYMAEIEAAMPHEGGSA